MKIRGTYGIEQTDRTLNEEQIKALALNEISRQLARQIIDNYRTKIIKEEASPKYPYGKYYLDINIITDEPEAVVSEDITVIGS